MKAMLLTAPGELVRDDVTRPGPEQGQLLVRVTHTGICGTDYKIFNGAIPVKYPRIMGHEIAGAVMEPGGSSLRSGDRVIVDPQLYCRSCFHCRIGQTHLCRNGVLVGRDRDGGFAEFVTVPPSHVFPLPASVETRVAPLIQVLTTCLHAQRQIDIFPGEFVVVLGLGVTGQLHVQLAKARGATVIGVTRSADKRALAETLGADLTIPGGDDAVARVREATDGRGADVIIETTGVVPSLSSAIQMARSGGRLLLFGIITAKEGALPFYDLYFKELALINARVAKSEDYPASIDLVERGHVRLQPLVSDVKPLEDLKAAIGMLGSDNGARMKIIMEHI
ncbi:MAG TPA: alcohol dehydrogenase catalytic domain-containing protein [Vicinamibacterales bacterium]|jgi:2-desacetyl-2-hydroxyethyl bacteriochlorophyllide A dehydrogenase|nr:alcohol dehydrogenase catalytic domain-containing protein [Vicinamibacterales bacterium]